MIAFFICKVFRIAFAFMPVRFLESGNKSNANGLKNAFTQKSDDPQHG